MRTADSGRRKGMLALWCCLCPALVVAQQARLALVVTAPAIQPAAALLVAELSGKAGLALLERTEVERILREQQLTAGNLTEATKLGQLLGADGLLLLDLGKENERSLLSARLLAVKPGVLLRTAQYPWPLQELTAWPKLVASQFTPLFPKLSVLVRDAVPLSILNLRAAVRSPEAEQLEKDLTLLLGTRLSRQPEVFVLERQRMAMLSAEKELKGMGESPFWNGSYLLEGVIDKDGYSRETLTVSLHLVAPDKSSTIIDVAGPRRDLPGIAESLVRQVLAKFKTATAPSWDPQAEAASYLEEARWTMRWKLYEQAQWAADSAWALGRHDLETARLRVTSYYDHRDVGRVGGIHAYAFQPQQLDDMAGALEAFAATTPFLATNGPPAAWSEIGHAELALAAKHLWVNWAKPEAGPALEPRLARLRAAARLVERLLLGGEERPTPHTYETPAGQRIWKLKLGYPESRFPSYPTPSGWLWTETPSEILEEYGRLLDLGLTETQRREFLEGGVALVSWTARDRAAVPRLWEEFLRPRITSTNLTVSLVGRMLRYRVTTLADLTAGPEGDYSHPAGPIFEVLDRHKADLLCRDNRLLVDALHVATGRQIPYWKPRPRASSQDVVGEFCTNLFHYWTDHGPCFDAELAVGMVCLNDCATNYFARCLEALAARAGQGTNQIAAWRRAALHAYLTYQPPPANGSMEASIQDYYRAAVFDMLFRAEDYSGQEATQAITELRRFGAGAGFGRALVQRSIAAVENQQAKPQPLARRPAPQVTAPPPGIVQTNAMTPPLVVSKWWEPGTNGSPTKRITDMRLLHVLYRESRLWCQGRFVEHRAVPNPGGWTDWNPEIMDAIFSIDLKGFSHWVAASPSEEPVVSTLFFGPWDEVRRSFEVLDGQVYRCHRGRLLAAVTSQTNWQDLNVPLPESTQPSVVNGRLYLGSSESILEYDPVRKDTRILASARRRPALNDMDRLGRFSRPVFFSGGSNTVHVVIGDTIWPWHTDTSVWGAAVPQRLTRGSPPLYADERQVLFRSGDLYSMPQSLHRLVGQRPMEVLFHFPASSSFPGTRTTKPLTKWNPVTGPKPTFNHLAPDGENLWWLRLETVNDAPVLFHYSEQWDEPMSIPLKFAQTPISAGKTSLASYRLSLLAVPEGLVIFPNVCPGLYLIPHADLRQAMADRLQEQPRRARVQAAAQPNSSAGATTTTNPVTGSRVWPQ
jgi:hypothetical protein